MDNQQQQFDAELQTYFIKIQREIKSEHIEYLKKHPELRQILNDFTSQCLLEKPENVYTYAQNYFSYFNQEKDISVLKPFLISGPCGVGKGTLVSRLLELYPDHFEFSVSYTTRQARPGEVNGKHYYFVTKDEFEKEIQKDAFIEYCEVHGNYYGTHKGQVEEIRKKDVYGAEKINRSLPNQVNYILIKPPSIDELKKRLIKRGTETNDVIERRVGRAQSEIQKGQEMGIYTEMVNDDLEEAYKQLLAYLSEYYPNFTW